MCYPVFRGPKRRSGALDLSRSLIFFFVWSNFSRIFLNEIETYCLTVRRIIAFTTEFTNKYMGCAVLTNLSSFECSKATYMRMQIVANHRYEVPLNMPTKSYYNVNPK